MSQIPGTNVAARIVPFDTLDTYASHDAQYGRDGWRSVADINERDAITDQRRKEGMIAYVQYDQTAYMLVGGIDNSNWVPFPVASVSGAGSILSGEVPCSSSDTTYTVTHPFLDYERSIPVVSVESDTNFYMLRVFERTYDQFKIAINSLPVAGEKLLWHLSYFPTTSPVLVDEFGDYLVDEFGDYIQAY
jgi:hypothetical protein